MKINLLNPQIIRTTTNITKIQSSQFRELVPIKQWSGFILVKDIPKEEFKNIVIGLSNELGFRFSGWILFNNPKNDNTDFYYFLSRHQRTKYGLVKSKEEYEEAFGKLALAVNSKPFVESHEGKDNQFRILFGLREGYDTTSKNYSIEDDVQKKLGEGFTFQKAEIFSTRSGNSHYTEEAILITGYLSKVNKVYLLAEELKQERFTVEDLQNGVTYTVETKYCKEPES